MEVCFIDGSRIGVAPNSCTIVYASSSHSKTDVYNTKEVLPEKVRAKLSLLPKALEQLAPSNRAATVSSKLASVR